MFMAVTVFSYNKTRYFRPLHTSTARTTEQKAIVFGQRCRCVDKEYLLLHRNKAIFCTCICMHPCMWRHLCVWVREEERKSVQRATATEWCQCNLSIVSCLVSCSKLWSVSIDQRKNLLPLTFDSFIDHFLLYTVEGKYSDSTQGLGRSPVTRLLIFKDHFHYTYYRTLRYELADWSFCATDIMWTLLLRVWIKIKSK